MAGLLLLAAIAGIGAASPGIGAGGPLRGHPLAVFIAVEIALALLLLGLTVLTRRSPAPGHLRNQLRYLLRWTIIVMMIVIAVIAAVNYVGTRHGSSVLKLLRQGAKPHKSRVLRQVAHPVHGPDLTYLLYALIAVLLIVAIVACALVIVRLRSAWGGLEVVEIGDGGDDDDSASLRRAVESGQAALHAVDEARAAIIACYLAMERSLATAGTARTAAETPAELLTRATGTGLLRGPAAGRLTALFYEARFSTHPLPDTAKVAATAALDEISAELRDPALVIGAAAGTGPAMGGPAVGGAAGGSPDGEALR